MYQKCSQHPELIRLIGAAAVSKRFRQMLLRNPGHILEHGYLGYQFDLTTEEAEMVNTSTAEDIQKFSLRLWEWINGNGHGSNNDNGNGGHRPEKLFRADQPFDDVLASTTVSGIPVRVKEEKQVTCPFSSHSTFFSWKGADMEPLILVVDDNREMAEGLRFALEMEGYRVALVSDGELAIEFLERERPDLILADVKMPRMDGYALLHVVKENAEWRDIPFVFVTAAADWRDAVMAKSMGAEEYIVKPFELEDLVEVVGRLTKAVEKVKVDAAGEEKRARP